MSAFSWFTFRNLRSLTDFSLGESPPPMWTSIIFLVDPFQTSLTTVFQDKLNQTMNDQKNERVNKLQQQVQEVKTVMSGSLWTVIVGQSIISR